jgi:AcrR family transcriptional regulator
VRRGEILDAAEVLLVAHGGFPLPLEALARAAQVSKALIYAYFPNQHDLANALLARRFDALLAAGLEAAAARTNLFDAAQACGALYFEEVAQAGPVAHIVLRDPFMAGRIDPELAAVRDRLARRLARLARLTLRLSPKEAVAALSLMTTIPEEAGRLVHAGDLTPERGRELTTRLIGSSLRALTPDL